MKSKMKGVLGVALVVMLLASLTVGLAAAPAGADPGKLKFTKLVLPKVEKYGPTTLIDDTDGITDTDTTITVDDATGFPSTNGVITIEAEQIFYASTTSTTFTGCVRGYGGTTEAPHADNTPVTNSVPSDHSYFADSEGDFWCAPYTDVGPIAIAADGKTMFAAVSAGPYLLPTGGAFGWTWWDVLKSTDAGYSWVASEATDSFFNVSGGDEPIVDIMVSPDYENDNRVFVATQNYVYQSVDAGKRFVEMDREWGSEMIRDLDVALDENENVAIVVGTWTGGGGGDVYVYSIATGGAWQAQSIGDDVLACAFIPNYTDENGEMALAAVVSDSTTTTVRFSYSNTGEGNGWGDDIADAPVRDANLLDFASIHARLGFPDDFDGFTSGNNICFAAIYSREGYDDLYFSPDDVKGDVYKIETRWQAGLSKAIDLDIRGVLTTLAPTATDVVSIDVCGPADSASIVVGLDYSDIDIEQVLVYHSEDSGETWTETYKPPTGGMESSHVYFTRAMTEVLMAPDYCDSGIAYASTWGLFTSAFHRTSDGATSWNQISIIDYADGTNGYYATPYGFSAAGYNAAGTLRMTTSTNPMPTGDWADCSYGALWERTGGKHWERIFSYALPTITDQLFQLIVLDEETMFAVDLNNEYMWRSSDGGATWPKPITTKDEPTYVVAVSATELWTAHDDGNIYWSTRTGVGWTKPDDSEATGDKLWSVAVAGDFVLASGNSGAVYISSDGGETVERVGLSDPGAAGINLASFDLGFAENNIIYNTTIFGSTGHGVWRCEVDLDDPHSSEWFRIDDIDQPDEYDPSSVTCASPAITLPPSGVLYVIDLTEVERTFGDDYTGGLWRSVNPTADIDSISPPYFEKENYGLKDGSDGLFILGLDLAPPTLAPTFFCGNFAAIAPPGGKYWEQVVMYTDTMNVGVPLADPANGATGVGLIPEWEVYPEVILTWQEMAGATSYRYQVATDADFKTKIADEFTDSLASDPLTHLYPSQTYYWRVQVAKEGSIFGAPLISPWSETYKFKTAIGASMARPDLEAPWPGEPDVDLVPTFEWSGIEWAVMYDYELAADPTTGADGYFTAPLKALTGTNALVSTAWKCDLTLDYSTRYYWHVKAIGEETETPWSDVGTFTTMGVPPEPPEVQPPIVVPPAEQITPAWIWAIVIIGAILVIAVIVLIVTTRRVP
jgi:hypothetical protein